MDIDRLRREIDTLDPPTVNAKIKEVEAVIQEATQTIKDLQEKRSRSELDHPAINRDSAHGKLWSMMLDPKAYGEDVLVYLLVTYNMN